MQQMLSSKVFRAIANFPSLDFACLPKIEKSWIEDLSSHMNMDNLFQKLICLNIEIAPDSLSELTLHLPILEQLRLTVRVDIDPDGDESSPYLDLLTLAFLKQLSHLHIRVGRSVTMTAIDLELVTEHLLRLESVEFYQIEGFDMATTFEDLSDDVFKNITLNLPNLRIFHLCFKGSRLTGDALFSLGRNCPLLKVCRIRIHELDLWGVALKTGPNFWSSLERCRLLIDGASAVQAGG